MEEKNNFNHKDIDLADDKEQYDNYDFERTIKFLTTNQKIVLLLRHFGYDAKESMNITGLNYNDYYRELRDAKNGIETYHIFYH